MRPISVTVGPVGSTAANNVATSQTPAAIGGTATATFTNATASIAATNSFVAGQLVYFTSTGQLPYPFVSGLPYYVISAGLTGSAFEVSGNYAGSAIVPVTAGNGAVGFPGYVPAASGTQTVNFGGSVALNGSLVANGIAVFPVPQRVKITTTDSTHIFTITGTSSTGTLLTETIAAAGSAITSALDYSTVTSITINGLATAAVTVGNGGSPLAATPWVRLDEWANTQVAIQINVTGTVNYTVQSTLDDPNSATNSVLPQNVTWVSTNDTNVVGATSSLQSNYLFAPTYARVLLNSGAGSCTATFTQANVANQ